MPWKQGYTISDERSLTDSELRWPERSIALDTTYLQLDGAGQVDLGAETLALKLHPLARLAGSSVSVPVLVEGPLYASHSRLDASGLDELGLLIDAWFGGDHPQICSDVGLAPPATVPR